MPILEDQLLTVDEAARRLLVDSKTIRRWVSQGRLPAYRLAGTGVRIRAADLDQLLRPIPTAVTR